LTFVVVDLAVTAGVLDGVEAGVVLVVPCADTRPLIERNASAIAPVMYFFMGISWWVDGLTGWMSGGTRIRSATERSLKNF
jgi:hypothetical protein